MSKDTFTKRGIAKLIVSKAIQSVVTYTSTKALEAAIEPEEDSGIATVIDFGTYAGGFIVAGALRDRTDTMVDRTADWYVARKDEKSKTSDITQ